MSFTKDFVAGRYDFYLGYMCGVVVQLIIEALNKC